MMTNPQSPLSILFVARQAGRPTMIQVIAFRTTAAVSGEQILWQIKHNLAANMPKVPRKVQSKQGPWSPSLLRYLCHPCLNYRKGLVAKIKMILSSIACICQRCRELRLAVGKSWRLLTCGSVMTCSYLVETLCSSSLVESRRLRVSRLVSNSFPHSVSILNISPEAILSSRRYCSYIS